MALSLCTGAFRLANPKSITTLQGEGTTSCRTLCSTLTSTNTRATTAGFTTREAPAIWRPSRTTLTSRPGGSHLRTLRSTCTSRRVMGRGAATCGKTRLVTGDHLRVQRLPVNGLRVMDALCSPHAADLLWPCPCHRRRTPPPAGAAAPVASVVPSGKAK